jgi:spore maturation protein CgeB
MHMRIAVPVASYHPGNTGEYVVNALQSLGIESQILSQEEFYKAFSNKEYDFYFCVDSGEAFSFDSIDMTSEHAKRIAFWFIDYRHNRLRSTRKPNDQENAKFLSDNGAWIFQAQKKDVEDAKLEGVSRCSWLPVAADPNIWSNLPNTEKKFDIGFVGNIWDAARLHALQEIQKAGFTLAFQGHGKAWKEDGARLLRHCKMGFNISSFYGTEVAYDINMRFFETLSCGVPLLTNSVPTLAEILKKNVSFVREYSNLQDIVFVARKTLVDKEFLSSGEEARKWILNAHTYVHRVQEAIEVMQKNIIN